MEIRSYRDLKVWQKAMEIAEEVYRITASFPKDELYGLTSQLRRAAVSIASDIAEGSSRRARGDYARFVNIASGSVAEVETQLQLAHRLHFITEDTVVQISEKLEEESKMLFALQRSLAEREAA